MAFERIFFFFLQPLLFLEHQHREMFLTPQKQLIVLEGMVSYLIYTSTFKSKKLTHENLPVREERAGASSSSESPS